MRSNRVQVEGTQEFHSRSWADWRVKYRGAMWADAGQTILRLPMRDSRPRDDGRRQHWTSVSAGFEMMGKIVNAVSGE